MMPAVLKTISRAQVLSVLRVMLRVRGWPTLAWMTAGTKPDLSTTRSMAPWLGMAGPESLEQPAARAERVISARVMVD